jgi:hypothetical protein
MARRNPILGMTNTQALVASVVAAAAVGAGVYYAAKPAAAATKAAKTTTTTTTSSLPSISAIVQGWINGPLTTGTATWGQAIATGLTPAQVALLPTQAAANYAALQTAYNKCISANWGTPAAQSGGSCLTAQVPMALGTIITPTGAGKPPSHAFEAVRQRSVLATGLSV